MSIASMMGKAQQTFISANGKNGFFSLYEQVFSTEHFDRIYVILGGPGTGKSTFLRKISEKGRGNGIAVEEIACSSDPDSLDGVILASRGKRIGLLDGTPPHGRIITRPALCEEIIDLGAFWDAEGLSEHKATLLALGEKKKRAYLRAYALLEALGALWEESRISLLPYFDTEKAKRQIQHKIGTKKQAGYAEYRLMRSFSGKGEIVLSPCDGYVQNLLFVGGNQIAAEIYLSYFEKILQKSEVARTVFLSPLDGANIDGIYLKDSQTLLVKESLKRGSAKGRRIVADRFFSSHIEESKERRACFESVKGLALAALSEAMETHAAIEEYYIDGMDFTALAAFREKKTEEIISRLLR